jgi:hypothetical protein
VFHLGDKRERHTMAPRGCVPARALLLVLLVTGALAPSSHAGAAHPNGTRLCKKKLSHGQDRFVNLATDAIYDRQRHRVGGLSLLLQVLGSLDPDGVPTQKPHALSGSAPAIAPPAARGQRNFLVPEQSRAASLAS